MSPRRGDVSVAFYGDDSDLQRTFDNVGKGARDMASDVEKAGDSSRDALDGLGGAADGAEGKFRGFGDTITGTGDIMQGFRDGNIAGVAMGFADLAGGITDFVVPALSAMKTAILTGLTPALTAISAHPFIALLVGGALLIAGLVLLEKKFGIVSKTVDAFKDAFTGAWPAIKSVLNLMMAGFEGLANGIITALTLPFKGARWLLDRVGVDIPDVPKVTLPRFHTGGIAGRDMLAVLQQGEQVIPAGQGRGATIVVNVSGVGMGRDFGDAVARALRDNKLIGVTV